MSILTLFFSLEGRIRRAQYWLGLMMVFGFAVMSFASIAILMRITQPIDPYMQSGPSPTFMLAGVAAMFAAGAILTWMHAAIHVKRWHDRDKSGVWWFIGLIPVVGFVVTFIECGLLDGTPGRNRFGRSPKGLARRDTVPFSPY